jgi:hypothetical protein
MMLHDQNNGGRAQQGRQTRTEGPGDGLMPYKNTKNGPRDIDDVPWAVGKFLVLFISFY